MGMALAAVVLWLATAVRAYLTVRQPDRARISMSITAVLVSIAFTVGALAGTIDSTLARPNASELLSHLLFTAGAYFALLFLRLVRDGHITRRAVAIHTVICITVLAGLVLLFDAADVHDRSAGSAFATTYAADPAAVLYRVVFSAYFVACLIAVTRTCLRHAFAAGDRARSLSLIGIGIGALLAAAASTAAAIQMSFTLATGRPAPLLAGFNTIAVAGAGVIAGLGVIVPVPVDSLLRWRRAKATSRELDPLWTDLTAELPEVVLSPPPAASPIERAEIVSTRRQIEIADALDRIHIDDSTAQQIRRSPDRPAALGRALRDRSAWCLDRPDGVTAAELLPTGDDDLGQLLAVAGAYGAAR